MANNSQVFRLRNPSDFIKIKNEGQVIHTTSWLLGNVLITSKNVMRVGWTLPSYVGSSVVRNRLKRWLREFFKQNSQDLYGLKCDLNLVFKKREEKFYSELEHRELDYAVEKLIFLLKRKM